MSTSVSARWAVLDIEGTLTATSQVHVVLYDYARARLRPRVEQRSDDPVVRDAVTQVIKDGGLADDASAAEVTSVLHRWMDEDRKAAPLKTLQGLIWQDGYARGELTTEYFADVFPALRKWTRRGLDLAVFSSGSVAGQIASFSNTTEGDLRGLFQKHFDTVNAGPKRDSAAYRAITDALGATDPADIVFLSDVPAELDAAVNTGWNTIGLARPGEPFAEADFGLHPVVTSFDNIHIEVPA